MAEPVRLHRVRSVLERRRPEITATYRAVGTGIGKRDPADDGYVITVYLVRASDVPAAEQAVDGVPLQFIVTGEFRAQRPTERDQ